MKTAEEIVNNISIYGRKLSEFLLPDQIEFVVGAVNEYGIQSFNAGRSVEESKVKGMAWDFVYKNYSEYAKSIDTPAVNVFGEM